MNLAVIGCNTMGVLHAKMAANCGVRIVACGDKHKGVAQSFADRFGAEPSNNCMAVIARPDVDVVAITTPTPTHLEYILAAAEAGKHIFCEKPFCRTVSECKQALAAAKKAKVRLFVGHVVRYVPEFEAIRSQIAAGKIGTPGFVKMYRGGIFPGGVNGWYRNYVMSGGVTLDSMIHDLDWLRYAFGEPERIYCQALRRLVPEPMDYSMATVRMKCGLLAKVVGTWAHPTGFRIEMEVCGDKGMLQYSSEESALITQKRQEPGAIGSNAFIPENPVAVSPYQLEWEDFLVWVEGRASVRVTPEDAVAAVRMATAALKSADTGKPVAL